MSKTLRSYIPQDKRVVKLGVGYQVKGDKKSQLRDKK
jgi:hypothetical protein